MILVYIEHIDPTPAETALAENVGASLRSGRFWKGEVERCSAVYTDIKRIADKYSRRGVKVYPVTQKPPTRKPKTRTRKPAK